MKFILLICLFCFFTVTPVSASVTDTYDHPTLGTRLVVHRHRHTLTLEGQGAHTFLHQFGDPSKAYSVHTVLDNEEGFILVGERLIQDSERYYEIFIMRLSAQGILLEEVYLEESRDDAIQAVFLRGDAIVLHVEGQAYVPRSGLERTSDKLYWFEQGVIVSRYEFEEEIFQIVDHASSLAIHMKPNQAYHYLWLDAHTLLTRGQLRGIEPGGVGIGEVTLQFVGTLYVNGFRYRHPITFDQPGHYEVDFEGAQFNFTLHPTLEGVKAHGMYKEPLSIDYTAGMAMLNDDLYYPGQRIDQPGRHVLRFEGPNYLYEVPFTLSANVQGVMDKQRYDTPRTIAFQGEGYLNNTYIESPYEVTESGQYVLRVYGVGGYEETHAFVLELEPPSKLDPWVVGEIILWSSSVCCGLYFIAKHLIDKRRKST